MPGVPALDTARALSRGLPCSGQSRAQWPNLWHLQNSSTHGEDVGLSEHCLAQGQP